MVVKCPNCGKVNKNTNIKCEFCSTQLIDENNFNQYSNFLVNNVWKNNDMGIEEISDTGVIEEFTYNNNYKYVNNNTIIEEDESDLF